jgi:hypothetical protein
MRRLPVLLVLSAWVVLMAACGSDDSGVRAADDAGSTTTDVPADAVDGPKLGDHWHIAVGFSACGVELPALTDAGADTTGIHTHGDGLIHVHPFTTDVAGEGAVLGAFFDTVGARVNDEGLETDGWKLPFKGECNGSPATMRAMTWQETDGALGISTSITSPDQLRSLPLRPDGAVLALALVTKDAAIPMPTSVSQLAAPSDTAAPVPAAPVPAASGEGTPATVTFGFAPVLGVGQPPCDDTATPSRDASQCYELAPVALGADAIAMAEAQVNDVEWTVHLELTDGGIDAFNELASACYDSTPDCPTRMLAIVVDRAVVSAPTLQTPSFEKGQIQISGGFTEGEARELADALSP